MADDLDVTGAWRSFCARLADAGSSLGGEPFPQSDAGRALGRAPPRTTGGDGAAGRARARATPPTRRSTGTRSRGCSGADRIPTTCTRGRRSIPPRPTACSATSPVCAPRSSRSSTATCTSAGTACSPNARSPISRSTPTARSKLWISPEPHACNWFESHADARMFLVRQYLCDWEHDRAAPLTIERVDTRGIARLAHGPARSRRRARPRRDLGRAVDGVLVHVRRARPRVAAVQRGRAARNPARRRADDRVRRGLVAARTRRGPPHHHRRSRRRLLGLDRASPLPARLRRLRRPPDEPESGAGVRRRRRSHPARGRGRDPGGSQLDRHRRPAGGDARVPLDRHALAARARGVASCRSPSCAIIFRPRIPSSTSPNAATVWPGAAPRCSPRYALTDGRGHRSRARSGSPS